MLELNSPLWKELSHAYGSAADIPLLLEQLKLAGSPEDYKSEPWFSLWSALCHQYDVYPASYAASPHIIAIAITKPSRDRLHHLYLASSIEAYRHFDDAPPIPEFLEEAYMKGLNRASLLIRECLELGWQETEFRILLGAVAVVEGHPRLGSAIFELEEETECPNCETSFPTKGYDLFV
jgi:hypothetical protein